jgi:hypothetical protein
MDECPDDIIGRDLVDIFDTTDIYRHPFIIGESDRCLIHDSDISMEYFMEMQCLISDSICMFFGIFIIDTIDLRRLDDDVALQFECAKYGT